MAKRVKRRLDSITIDPVTSRRTVMPGTQVLDNARARSPALTIPWIEGLASLLREYFRVSISNNDDLAEVHCL
jgi:hypothetical protein